MLALILGDIQHCTEKGGTNNIDIVFFIETLP